MPRLLPTLALAVALGLGAAPAQADGQARSVAPNKTRPPRSTLKRTATAEVPSTLEEQLAEQLRAIWAGRPLRRGTTAAYVVDARTGEPLFAVHEDLPLNPASNVKLVSTATALQVLGPEWTYVTQLLGPLPSRDGVVEGDLFLYGNADPTLRTRDLERFAVDLLSAGVRKVEGSVLLGDHALRDAVANPRVLVRVTGVTDGEPPEVTVTPPMPNVQLEVTALTTTRGRRRPTIAVSTERVRDEDGDKLVVRVSGRIRAGRTGKYSRKVPSPALFTGYALRGALIEAGIEVTGGVRLVELDTYVGLASAAGYLPTELARRESAPVKELVARINKPSNNFLADRLLMTVGAVRYGGEPSMDKGVDAMNEWLASRARLDPSSLVLDTGSGLSYNSRLSSRQIVRVLRAASGLIEPAPHSEATASLAVGLDGDQTPVFTGSADEDELAHTFHESLAVAGVDGTLRGRYKKSPLAGLLVGKTGTLTRVIALSGFVSLPDTPPDDAVAFAFVTNGHVHRRRNTVRNEHARMARAILDYLEQRRARDAAAITPPASEPIASPGSTRPPE